MRFLRLLLVLAASYAPTASAQVQVQAALAESEARIGSRALDRAAVRIVTVSGAESVTVDSHASRVRRMLASPTAAFGTGFFVDPNGLVATAAHVVAGADYVAVLGYGLDQPTPATVVYVDPAHDIAFLYVALVSQSVIEVPTTPRALTVGEAVYATGFPFDVRERRPAALAGVVSRENNDGTIHTTLSVNPGNSGGPAVDAAGHLLGVVSRGSNLRAGVQGFAILEPVRDIIYALGQARALVASRAQQPTVTDLRMSRIVADFVGTDTELRLFRRTPIEDLRAVAVSTQDPEAKMIVAAHAWNMHISLLEHREVREVSQLPASEQATASELRTLAVNLVNQAYGTAPFLRVNYAFGRSLLVQGDRSFIVRGIRND